MGHLKADSFYRLLADGRFYNPRRVSKIVDIDFFIDEVLTKLRPLEIDRVMHSPTPLWVAVADFVTARTFLFHAQAGKYPLLQILKAATAMPVLYNQLIPLGEIQGFDAGFIDPFPLDEALAHENTHVLVLLAAPEGFVSPPVTAREMAIIDRRFARGNGQMNEMYRQAAGISNRLRDLAHGRAIPSAASSIATIAPTSDRVDVTTQDTELLRTTLLDTARGTLRLFGCAEDQLEELVRTGTL
jgi:predicted patatin/cPLA2 family phospholipase